MTGKVCQFWTCYANNFQVGCLDKGTSTSSKEVGLQAWALHQSHTECFHLKKGIVARERFGIHMKFKNGLPLETLRRGPWMVGCEGLQLSRRPQPRPKCTWNKSWVCAWVCVHIVHEYMRSSNQGVGAGDKYTDKHKYHNLHVAHCRNSTHTTFPSPCAQQTPAYSFLIKWYMWLIQLNHLW